jgi:hypothetical protein
MSFRGAKMIRIFKSTFWLEIEIRVGLKQRLKFSVKLTG